MSTYMTPEQIKEWGVLVGVILANLVAALGLYLNYKTKQTATAADTKATTALARTENGDVKIREEDL